MANKKLPKSAVTLKKNRFTFDLDVENESGEVVSKTFSIPKLGLVKPRIRREFNDPKRDAYGNMVAVLTMIDPELGEIAADLEADQLDWIADNWSSESGITPGESKASTDS